MSTHAKATRRVLADGRCVVERRDLLDGAKRAQMLDRGEQIGFAVAEVGAEAKVDGHVNKDGRPGGPPHWGRFTLKYSYASSVAVRPRGGRFRKPSWMRYGS